MSVFEIVEPSLAWPKSARIGFYGPRQRRQPPPQAPVESSWFFAFFVGALGPVLAWSRVLVWVLLSFLAAFCLAKVAPDAKKRPPESMLGAILAYVSVMF